MKFIRYNGELVILFIALMFLLKIDVSVNNDIIHNLLPYALLLIIALGIIYLWYKGGKLQKDDSEKKAGRR